MGCFDAPGSSDVIGTLCITCSYVQSIFGASTSSGENTVMDQTLSTLLVALVSLQILLACV